VVIVFWTAADLPMVLPQGCDTRSLHAPCSNSIQVKRSILENISSHIMITVLVKTVPPPSFLGTKINSSPELPASRPIETADVAITDVHNVLHVNFITNSISSIECINITRMELLILIK
jgi:hypothetical protein